MSDSGSDQESPSRRGVLSPQSRVRGQSPPSPLTMIRRRNPDWKLRPPNFSGKKTELVKHFFSKFEKFSEHHEVPQDELVSCLGLMLEGEALEYFDNQIAKEEDQTYDDVKASLFLRFDDEKIKLVIRSKLSNRRLKTGETVTELFAEIEKEGAKVGLSEEDLLFVFLNGLP